MQANPKHSIFVEIRDHSLHRKEKEYKLSKLKKIAHNSKAILLCFQSYLVTTFQKFVSRPNTTSKNLKITIKQSKPITALVDLDHTLIFSSMKKLENKKDCLIIQNKFYVYKRPDLDKFLSALSEFCEVVIYTSATKEYADSIINIIDKRKVVSKRFYRDHCQKIGDNYFKDVKKLGYTDENLVIVDDIPECHLTFKDNIIQISKWKGENDDSSLTNIASTIKKMVMKK